MALVLPKLYNIIPQFFHKITLTSCKNASCISISIFKNHNFNLKLPATTFRLFNTTTVRQDLLEFFDDSKNWPENEVRTGRAWRKDDLRIKSNSDLHKLWYVLLKEKNMLLTMEAEYERLAAPMPNPERIYKVEESMKNLEIVVRERNKAYNLLETGYDGERPTQLVENALGMHKFYRLCEHHIPYYMNRKWRENNPFNHWDPYYVVDFKRRLREKHIKERTALRRLCKQHIKKILKKYPNTSDEALSEKYPIVDMKRFRAEMKQ